MKKKISIANIIIYVFLSVLVVVYLAPLLWMFFVSFKTNAEVMTSPFGLPEVIRWDNYSFAWSAGYLGRATSNSAIVCVTALGFSLLIGSMASFAIARMRWKLSKLCMTYFLIGMMVPVHCVLIPLFKTFSGWGLSNSLVGLILPYITFSLPITIFIMTGFLKVCR